jgi:hypothetical protein
MEVIAHQTVVIMPNVEAVAVACQQLKEVEPVLVVVEDGLAGMAAIEDVVTDAVGPQVAAGSARHAESSTKITGG